MTKLFAVEVTSRPPKIRADAAKWRNMCGWSGRKPWRFENFVSQEVTLSGWSGDPSS